MLFNSYIFLFAFLPVVTLVWWLLARRERLRLAWLTLASYAFYSYFEFPRGLELLPLLIASTTADYVAGVQMARTSVARRRKQWLLLALTVNLGLLAYFKYLGFFESIANGVLALAGVPVEVPIHSLVLPIGISFYTFNSMSYSIDIYRGKVEPARSFLHYSAFVSLFPHLIAGPIVRYADIAAQLDALKRRLTSTMVSVGAFFFICGLTKKLLLADTLAPTVDRLFASADSLSFMSAWAASLGYSLQMYFDFSGYSDMAVGLAMMLGFSFPQNFASPYKARDISEFWRRWHMTLSRWMRDYVFIPLGGSHGTLLLTARNLFITMLLVGLWHGAAWTFVVFGLAQGVLLGGRALARNMGLWKPPAWLGRTLTYLSFVVTLMVFRSPSIDVAGTMASAMIGMQGLGLTDFGASAISSAIPVLFMFQMGALLAWVNIAPNTFEYQLPATRRAAMVLGVLLAIDLALVAAPSPFLYFQF